MKHKSQLNIGWKGLFLLGFNLLFLLLSINSKGQETLPPEIKKIFFETSKFNNSIWLELPDESSLAQFQKISNTPNIYESGIPSTTLTYHTSNSLEDYNKFLLSFLFKNNYIKIETKTQTKHSNYGSSSTVYHFIFYSDGLKKNIQNSNATENYQRISKPYLKLAHRSLISIDFKNQYEDAPGGMKRTFYSITFSYKIVNDLTNLPTITKIFKGKGKIYKDPDDGTWKMVGPFENLGIGLSDDGSSEFLRIIRLNYTAFKFDDEKPSQPISKLNNLSSNNEMSNNRTINTPAIETNKILISSSSGKETKTFIAGSTSLTINKKSGTKENSDVLFLLDYKDGPNSNIKPEVKDYIIKQFKDWIEKSTQMTTADLERFKKDSLLKIELIFTVRLLAVKSLDAFITTKVHITQNGTIISDESFERSRSLFLESNEPFTVLDNVIKNSEKKLGKTLAGYISIK